MQITLAPGTRRNRRNFMLLRNATCPPSPSSPPLLLSRANDVRGLPSTISSLRYVCRHQCEPRWLFTTMIYFICLELNNEMTTGNVGHLFITVYGGPKSILRIDEWLRRGPVWIWRPFPFRPRAMMDRWERLVLTLGEKAVFKANLKPGFQGMMEWGKGCLNEYVIRLDDSDVVYTVKRILLYTYIFILLEIIDSFFYYGLFHFD